MLNETFSVIFKHRVVVPIEYFLIFHIGRSNSQFGLSLQTFGEPNTRMCTINHSQHRVSIVASRSTNGDRRFTSATPIVV